MIALHGYSPLVQSVISQQAFAHMLPLPRVYCLQYVATYILPVHLSCLKLWDQAIVNTRRCLWIVSKVSNALATSKLSDLELVTSLIPCVSPLIHFKQISWQQCLSSKPTATSQLLRFPRTILLTSVELYAPASDPATTLLQPKLLTGKLR